MHTQCRRFPLSRVFTNVRDTDKEQSERGVEVLVVPWICHSILISADTTRCSLHVSKWRRSCNYDPSSLSLGICINSPVLGTPAPRSAHCATGFPAGTGEPIGFILAQNTETLFTHAAPPERILIRQDYNVCVNRSQDFPNVV